MVLEQHSPFKIADIIGLFDFIGVTNAYARYDQADPWNRYWQLGIDLRLLAKYIWKNLHGHNITINLDFQSRRETPRNIGNDFRPINATMCPSAF